MRLLLTADPGLPVPPKFYGGIERIIDGLVFELRRRGHEVGLVAHPDSTAASDAFFPWPGSWGDNWHNMRALWSAVRRFRPDVVHSFSRLGFLPALLLSGQRALMSYQRPTGGRRLAIAARLGGRRLAFTGCSEYIAAMGRSVAGDWSAVPNFVDTSLYEFTSSVAADAPLVFLSRIERIKGAHTAIEIAKRAGSRLLIAGNQVDDPGGRRYWHEEIEPRLEPGVVDYVGPVNDTQKVELLGRAAAMIVPIEWDEPFGIVFAEALACGTPVISCPRGALPEIIKNGEHGFLVRSVGEGIAAVARLPSISRAACRRRAETAFSRGVVVNQYEALYHSLAAEAV